MFSGLMLGIYYMIWDFQYLHLIDLFLSTMFILLILESVWVNLIRYIHILNLHNLPEIDYPKIQREFLFIRTVINTHKFQF